MLRKKLKLEVLGLIILAVLIVVVMAAVTWRQKPQRLPPALWQPYSDQALADAKAAHKPVIMDFYTDWCQPCKLMARYVFQNSRFQAAATDFVLLRANMTDLSNPMIQRVGRQFRIGGYPTVVFFDRDGRERGDLRVEGAYSDWEAFLGSFLTAMELTKTGAPISEPSKQ